MSRKERDRLRVVSQLDKGQLSQGQASEQLGVSVRQVRRILRRYEKEGDRGLVHRLRGRPSNRKLATELQEKTLGLVRTHYLDFGPTLAQEYLHSAQGITVSRETLRGWMIEGKIWEPRARGVKHRQWRERRRAWESCYRWTLRFTIGSRGGARERF